MTDLSSSLDRLRERHPEITSSDAALPDWQAEHEAEVAAATRREKERARARREEAWAERMPRRLAHARLGHFTERVDVHRVLTEWAGDPGARNLVITGPVGTGKSHAAVALCRHMWDQGHDAWFLPVVQLLDHLRPNGRSLPGIRSGYEGHHGEWIEDGTRAPDPWGVLVRTGLLVIDDLGTQRETDWTHERLCELLNQRYNDMLPTVVTTNLTPDKLAEVLGPRAYSRVTGHDTLALVMKGEDRRRARAS